MSRSNVNSCQADIMKRFDEKLKKLEESLPEMEYSKGINCAELTLTNILDVLGIDNFFFHNIAIPLAGGFGGYKSKKGWMGACGAVAGGCAAIGVIMGGQEKINPKHKALVMYKASKYCSAFEKEFGSVVCSEICGHDFSSTKGLMDYLKEDTWRKKCYKFVLFGIDKVRKLTEKELRKKWE
ncbi:MAG: C-GCAxxG-C-C family protein [Promethearchaeota archaeon]